MARPLKASLDDPISRHTRDTFVSIPEQSTIAETLTRLRGMHLPEQIVYFYVVDAQGRLSGVIPTRRMLMSVALDPRRCADNQYARCPQVKGAVPHTVVLLGDLARLADVGLTHLQEDPAGSHQA